METRPMIEAEGLAKYYGKTRALAGAGFAVPAGTILGLLGAGLLKAGGEPLGQRVTGGRTAGIDRPTILAVLRDLAPRGRFLRNGDCLSSCVVAGREG